MKSIHKKFKAQYGTGTGKEYKERDEKQLMEYLDYFHQKKGYMLSFNFNKKKTVGVEEIRIEDRVIIEAVV